MSGRYVALQLIVQQKLIPEQKFRDWKSKAVESTMEHLKKSILAEGPDKKLFVNFHHDMWELIKETKLLDRMGFPVPETALNVTLQEEKYLGFYEKLQKMLNTYHGVLAQLNEDETKLLDMHIKHLRGVLNKGLSPYNWNSLGIDLFISECTKVLSAASYRRCLDNFQAINEFQSLVGSVHNAAQTIQGIVDSITSACLLAPLPPETTEIMELQEFATYQEQHRMQIIESLVRKYRLITDIMFKV